MYIKDQGCFGDKVFRILNGSISYSFYQDEDQDFIMRLQVIFKDKDGFTTESSSFNRVDDKNKILKNDM